MMQDISEVNVPQAEAADGEFAGISSESVSELAMGLLANLTDEERNFLEGVITPQAAQLLAKAFGPQFWALLSPLLSDDAPEDRAKAEEELRAVMRDPRYWRDRDGVLVRQVTDGFRRLYPE